MPAALCAAGPCGCARQPARLYISRRLSTCPARTGVRMGCSERSVESEPERPSEDERTDDESPDVDSQRGGRNAVRALAQDNSFIGVVVLALGAGLVASANNLLSVFGIEPPKSRAKVLKPFEAKARVGGPLPRRRASYTKVVRLTDRIAPKLQVPSGTGPNQRRTGTTGISSRPGGRSGQDASLASPSSQGPNSGSTLPSSSPSLSEAAGSTSPTKVATATGESAPGKAATMSPSQGSTGDLQAGLSSTSPSSASSSAAAAAGAAAVGAGGGRASSAAAASGSADSKAAGLGADSGAATSGMAGGEGASLAAGVKAAGAKPAGPAATSGAAGGKATSLTPASGAAGAGAAGGKAASLAAASSAAATGPSGGKSAGKKLSDPFFTPTGSGASYPAAASAAAAGGSSGGSAGGASGGDPFNISAGGAAAVGGSAAGKSTGDRLNTVGSGTVSQGATTWPAMESGAVAGIGSTQYSQTTSSNGGGNGAAVSTGGGSGSGGGKGRGGGGGGGGGDDMDDARFPWVPVLLFLAAAATYPVFRHTMGKQGQVGGAADSESSGKDALEGIKAMILAGVAAGGTAASAAGERAGVAVEGAKHVWGDFRCRADAFGASVFKREEQTKPGAAGKEKDAAAAVGVAGGVSQLSQGTVATTSQATTSTTAGGKGTASSGQASGWWWYPLLLAAVGVAAYVVVKKTSGDDGAGAATAAAAAGLQGSRNSNQQGNARAASPSYVADAGTREVAHEVTELHAKFQQRDIEYANLSKNVERIEQQESKLRQDSAADVQAVRQQINEMRQSLSNSRNDS